MLLTLKVIVGILSLIPAYYGATGAIFGAAQLLPAESVNPAIDSQYRFLGAVYFGLAMTLWWIVPRLEQHTTLLRIIILALFLGGLARAFSYATVGQPPSNFIFGMVLELCLPLLLIWHGRVRED